MKDANNILMKFISTQGYKRNSPDVNNPINVIPSNRITMKGVDFPVYGVDNLGNGQLMMPGGEYDFPGDYVVETPSIQYQKGGPKKQPDSYKATVKNYENSLMDQHVNPFMRRTLDKANKVGINSGGHNGPLDAIRHASSAAAMSSVIPSWANFIPGVAVANLGLTNLAGIAHEAMSPNPMKEHGSDLYNNFVGSVIGVLPVSEETKQDLIIKAQNNGILSNLSDGKKAPKNTDLSAPAVPKKDLMKKNKNGGEHGGLDRWFAEKWVDVKTGKECGRQEGEKRAGYPACRPSKRISSDTPKTASELSSSEKEKFKRTKTSSERIPYQHKRKDQGGIIYNDMEYNTDMEFMREGGNVPTNPELWSRAKSAAKAKYDVYPSAYANGFAAKWYKERGGGWRKKAEMGGCMECGGQMQEGGEQPVEQAPNITDALGEISMMIENGTDPNEIMTMLVEQGISEDEASSIINSAMTEIEEDDIEEEDADLDEEDIEPDSPVDEEDSSEDDALFFEDDAEQMKYGGIKIDPAKKGTFKAQATRMGMSVQEAAEHILENKEEFSPAMVKKANFAKNFAKELGGHMYEMAAGGTVPERYKNMGFTKVGVKKQSTRPGKKWMVLAKKGDKYKVVHGGWKGMQDFKQHRSEERKDRFWDRMGGKDSAKAKDPFSPLYWHKKFGTWAEGGEPQNAGFQALPDAVKEKILENMKYDNGGESMYDYTDYVVGDVRTNKTERGTINSLENNAVNRGLAMANTLGDPRMMMWALPNKGILGTIKGVAGAAAGLSGAALGYKKLFAGDKSTDYITNAETKESGKMEDVIQARRKRQDDIMKDWSTKPYYQDSPLDEKRRKDGMFPSGPVGPDFFDGDLPTNSSTSMMARYGGSMKRKYQDGGTFKEWFAKNSMRPDVMQNVADQAKLEEMWKAETAQQQPVVANTAGPAEVATSVGNTEVAQTPGGSNPPGQTSPAANKVSYTNRGDSIGIVAANNALAGLGMVNQVLDAKDYQKEYEERMREIGNTMSRYNPQNAVNPFGNYTLNAGPASNFGLVANTPIQDFGTKMSSAKFGGLIPFIPATRSYEEGGEYYADEDEIKRILAMGGEIEFID